MVRKLALSVLVVLALLTVFGVAGLTTASADSGRNPAPVSAVATRVYLDVARGWYSTASGTPMTVMAEGVPAVNGVQINIVHSSAVTLVDIKCVGIFGGSYATMVASVQNGTLVGCFLLSSYTTQSSGALVQFRAVPMISQGLIEISIGPMGGGFGTMFSKDGDAVDPGNTVSKKQMYVRRNAI